MYERDWRESELRTFVERHVLSLCWIEKLGYGINSHSMAALFDIGVICGNMAANRKVRNDIEEEEKVRYESAKGGFFSVRVTTLGGNGG